MIVTRSRERGRKPPFFKMELAIVAYLISGSAMLVKVAHIYEKDMRRGARQGIIVDVVFFLIVYIFSPLFWLLYFWLGSEEHPEPWDIEVEFQSGHIILPKEIRYAANS